MGWFSKAPDALRVEADDEEARLAALVVDWLIDWMISPDHIDRWVYSSNDIAEYPAKNISLGWMTSNVSATNNSLFRLKVNGQDQDSKVKEDPRLVEASIILLAHLTNELYPKELQFHKQFVVLRERQVEQRKRDREARLRVTLASLSEVELLEGDLTIVEDDTERFEIHALHLRQFKNVRVRGIDFPVTYGVDFQHHNLFLNPYTRTEMADWLKANTTKGTAIFSNLVVFEHEDDALLCRMSFT